MLLAWLGGDARHGTLTAALHKWKWSVWTGSEPRPGTVSAIFPSLLPGELFYNAAARFQELMRFRSGAAVREALFGSRDITAVVDLPGHLQQFVDRLPPNHPYPVCELIRKHTLFPFYAPFVRADRASAAFELLREGATWGAGFTRSLFPVRISRSGRSQSRPSFGMN